MEQTQAQSVDQSQLFLAMKVAAQLQAQSEKQAGPVSEVLSGFNPLNMYGGSHLGGLAALATPTRSLARQAEYDSNDGMLRALGNVLVPGMGPYNAFKRTGAAIRSPEMRKIKQLREADKLKRELALQAPPAESAPQAPAPEAPAPETEAKAAGWKSEIAGMLNPVNMVAGYPAAALAAVTPTRTLDEQAAADEEVLANIFVPGRNVYNMWKRTGAATRSPEMLQMRANAKKQKLEKLMAATGQAPAQAAPANPEVSKAASLRNFGAKYAFNIGDLTKNLPTGVQTGLAAAGSRLGAMGGAAGAGALGGAALGGLAGMINPGSDDVYDDNGKVVGRQQRSRFGAAMRGALGGGAAGGLAGGALEHFRPGTMGQMQSGLNSMRQMYNRNTPMPTKSVQTARTAMTNAGEEPMYDEQLGANAAMQAAQRG
jgi:hypothetical protein